MQFYERRGRQSSAAESRQLARPLDIGRYQLTMDRKISGRDAAASHRQGVTGMAVKARYWKESERARQRRLRWFLDARFGMFIHWGLYAQVGREASAPLSFEQYPMEEYEKLADTWKPKPDAVRSLARLAKKAGMRYMVLGSKHVEGFCLWDCKLTDYTAPKRGPGRDLVAEFVDAARAEGMRVGLYYPLADYHHPDGVRCQKGGAARRRFVDYNHGQLRELLTNYGKIDLLWYDGAWPLYDPQLKHVEMNKMVRKLQPDILVNDRSGLPGDFKCHECSISAEPPGRAWESCMTFNEEWGYTPIDTNYKSAWEVLRMLRQVAAGRGNLLMNVGPAPDGSVPKPCVDALLDVGKWLKRYGKSIYDATDPVPEVYLVTGRFTRKGNTLYFHCHHWPGRELAIGGLTCKVLDVRFMGGRKVKFTQKGARLVFHGLPAKAPAPLATVFEMKIKGTPRIDIPPYNIDIVDKAGWKRWWSTHR